MDDNRDQLELARACWRGARPLDAGAIVYESLEPAQRPGWAASLLELALSKIPAPNPVTAAVVIARERSRWHEAHQLFREIRAYTLREGASQIEHFGLLSMLHLAENTAKVTYNASGMPAPFDHDSGWWVASNLLDVTTAVADPGFADQALDLLVAPLRKST